MNKIINILQNQSLRGCGGICCTWSSELLHKNLRLPYFTFIIMSLSYLTISVWFNDKKKIYPNIYFFSIEKEDIIEKLGKKDTSMTNCLWYQLTIVIWQWMKPVIFCASVIKQCCFFAKFFLEFFDYLKYYSFINSCPCYQLTLLKNDWKENRTCRCVWVVSKTQIHGIFYNLFVPFKMYTEFYCLK